MKCKELLQPALLDLPDLLGLDVGNLSVVLLGGLKLNFGRKNIVKSSFKFFDFFFSRIFTFVSAAEVIILGYLLSAVTADETLLRHLFNLFRGFSTVEMEAGGSCHMACRVFIHEIQTLLRIEYRLIIQWPTAPFLNFSQV